jgi:hypothetical protein
MSTQSGKKNITNDQSPFVKKKKKKMDPSQPMDGAKFTLDWMSH